MKSFQTLSKKTLLYNLILFDFILLECSTQKISNFFIQKIQTIGSHKAVNQLTYLSIDEVTKSFKRFIRLLKFLKKEKNKKITIIVNSFEIIKFLCSFFKNFKLNVTIRLNTLGVVPFSKNTVHSAIFLDFVIPQSLFSSYFFRNCFLVQSINSSGDSPHYSFYKIFADMEDYKKIIFFNLLLVSIFKN